MNYKCAMCKEVFEEGRTKEDALAELAEVFPGASVEDCDVVCDDCWKKIDPRKLAQC